MSFPHAYRRRFTAALGTVGLLAVAGSSWAQGDSLPTAGLAEQTEGFSASLDYWVEGLSNVAGGQRSKTITAGLANLNLDYKLGGITAHANIYGPHGSGLTEESVGDFSVISNIDTTDDPRLQELWMEGAFGEASSLRFGMLAADTEFWGTEYGGLFINSVFGAPTSVSGNLPGSSIFPVATLGVRYARTLASGTTLRAAVLDGDAGDPADDNRYGLDVSLGEGALILFEAQADRTNRFGGTNTLRLSTFGHTSDFTNEHGETVSGSWGFVTVVDWALSKRVGWFGRLTFAEKTRSLAPLSLETGIHLAELGGGPGVLGIGLAYVDLNGTMAALDDPSLRLDREGIVEVTYEIPLGEYFALQPDLQYVLSPGGDASVDDALVVGLRAKASLAF